MQSALHGPKLDERRRGPDDEIAIGEDRQEDVGGGSPYCRPPLGPMSQRLTEVPNEPVEPDSRAPKYRSDDPDENEHGEEHHSCSGDDQNDQSMPINVWVSLTVPILLVYLGFFATIAPRVFPSLWVASLGHPAPPQSRS
jgi:hypothetical protein